MFYEFEKEEKRDKCEEANDLCLWKCSMWKRKGVCVKVEGVVSTTVGKNWRPPFRPYLLNRSSKNYKQNRGRNFSSWATTHVFTLFLESEWKYF